MGEDGEISEGHRGVFFFFFFFFRPPFPLGVTNAVSRCGATIYNDFIHLKFMGSLLKATELL
jgi:hypothetical protein